MNLELSVVRFNNEDVIATSCNCGSAYGLALYGNMRTSGHLFDNVEMIKNGGTDPADWKAKFNFKPSGLPEGVYVVDMYYPYHCDESGNFIEKCDELPWGFANHSDFEKAYPKHNVSKSN